MDSKSGGKEWKSLINRLLPYGYDVMWRPSRGVRAEGEPERTWKERLNNLQGS